MKEGGFSGTPELIYEKVKLNKRDFWREVDLTERILQKYYDENPETAVICHNDPHLGRTHLNIHQYSKFQET